MNNKLKILILGLLFILCVNSVYATDSLNNIALNDDTQLDEPNYIVNETILINHDVSITSKNYSIISSTNDNTIFNISSNGKLILSNLNLTNAKGINGGAIYNNGVLILNNCNFMNNEAHYGGAIYNNGTIIINNCTFESNIASISGGAIYNLQDNLTIQDSSFIENYAKVKNGILQGGAIANYGNNLTVNNCSFVKNHLYNTYWYKNGLMYGGAIYNSGNNLLVKNSKFNRNYIYGYTDSANKNVDLADKYGGAIYSNGNISTFINNEFDSNEIYSMISSYVLNKKIYLSNKGIGSAIATYNKAIIINNSFLNNSAASPPININKGEGCIIVNNTFINNNARNLGQSIWIRGNNSIISKNTFYRDGNATDKGYFEDPTHWEVYEILILDDGTNNTISYNYFGNSNGIHYLNSFSTDKTVNLTINNNIFNNSKNSVFVEHGNNINISSNVFINSTHAIETYTGRYIDIKNNYFYDGGSSNTSYQGYIHINSHFTDISGNVFRKVGANDSAGAIIAIMVRDNITIADNSFVENTVANGKGIISSLFGGFYYIGGITDVDGPLGNVEIKNNYFANNSLNDGAIIESRASKINIEQNILENNDGLIILANDTYYTTQYMNFTQNQIKDFSGNIKDYSYFYNSRHFDGSNNENYTGDSSSFLDKIYDFVKNLLDEFTKGRDSGKGDTNKSTSNSTSDITDKSDSTSNSTSDITDKSDSTSNSTDSNVDSDVGDSLDKSYSSKNNQINKNSPSKSESAKSDASSSSSPKSYEIEKSKVSKEISNNNSLILAIVVIIAIFILLVIGYKKK